MFEKKSFGGELELGDIEAFFRECDLYPSQAEVDEAIDVTMRGRFITVIVCSNFIPNPIFFEQPITTLSFFIF